MAKAYIRYVFKNWETDTSVTLCFVCAVRQAMKVNSAEEKIFVEADGYESYQCSECDHFLDDEVMI